ncbi:MAG: peptide ABC transporter substrate-binding protein [Chloroflexi bacterium]|nr:peptide ABC transporter substrate-binding protein [Chloroflexota bacterium]
MSRKSVFIALLLVLSLLAASVPAAFAQDNVDVYGRELPADAAPYEMQVYRNLCDSARQETSLSSIVTVYSRICSTGAFDKFSDSLVVLNNNMEIIPSAATSWSVSEDGLTWTFNLRGDQIWSDGTPVTAHDWVESWRFMADPDHAYDFVWLWLGIIDGWDEAVAGEIGPDEIGLEAVDDNTLAVSTQVPFPPLPATFFFWPPMQAKALTEIGPEYILDPATHVSAGPFILREFEPGSHAVLEANPDYVGPRRPWFRRMEFVYGDMLNSSFLAFQDHEIDQVHQSLLSPADFDVIFADEVMSQNYRQHAGDFRTDYLLMDTFTEPFNDVNVRLAFAKALDRESIVENVVGTTVGIPAYSFLAPGFPASNSAGLQDIQDYDCEAAQALLADAGYPGGEGFPAVELALRGESAFIQDWFIATAASISQCLNVEITVNNLEFQDYMTRLLERPTTLQFGGVSYGMDYLDPANMMGVWVSTGRHSWRNEAFDNLVREANSFTGDPAERIAMYQEAERIMVEDVGGIFLVHRIQGDLWQPYMSATGNCWEPDRQGLATTHWGNEHCWGEYYITEDVMNYDTHRNE